MSVFGRQFICFITFHDWRYRNTMQRACYRCGKKQVKYHFDPEKWVDIT